MLNFKGENFIRNPMAHLQNLFMAGKLDEVKTEALRMVNNPLYRFFQFEEEFNRAGYDLLSRNQTKPALFVFQLTTDLFPKSANAWDSLAEAHWKDGQIDKAVEYYNKAIELDPKGNAGTNARNKLKKIKEGK